MIIISHSIFVALWAQCGSNLQYLGFLPPLFAVFSTDHCHAFAPGSRNLLSILLRSFPLLLALPSSVHPEYMNKEKKYHPKLRIPVSRVATFKRSGNGKWI
jgi:hypothetical protein